MNKKILVTGGAGFIGTNLVDDLIGAGCEVIVVDDLSAGDKERLPQEVTFLHMDVRDTESLVKSCVGVEGIVHLAARPRVQDSIDNPQEAHAVNVDGTLSVLEAARKAGVKRVVLASTSAIYGDQETLPLSLDLPAEPKSPYALHKLMGEGMMKMWHQLYGIETISLRFFNVYGPHFDPDGPYALVIGRFLKLVDEGKPLTITGDGEQTRDFIHVSDVAKAILLSLNDNKVGHGEVLNVGFGEEVSINKIAELIGGDVEYVEARHEPRHTLADISETKRLLDWEPSVKLEQGIADLRSQML